MIALIMFDFLKVCGESPDLSTKVTKEAAELEMAALKLKSVLSGIEELHRMGFMRRQMNREYWDELASNLQERRLSILQLTEGLPVKLQEPDDVLTKIAQTPRVALSHLRAIADQLGYCIIPHEYMTPKAYESEDYDTKKAIQGFARELKPIFDTYVLTPVHYYDINAHIRAAQDLPMFTSTMVANAFMAISFVIPALRGIVQDLKNLQGKVENIDERLHGATTRIEEMQRRIVTLEHHVESQRRAIVETYARAEAAEKAPKRAEAAVLARDPLLLGVKKGIDVSTAEYPAIIGPCWGPDLDDLLCKALKLEEVDGQRKKLATLALRWR